MPSNKVAFLDGAEKPLRVGDAEVPKPGPNDIIIKNHAIAINPLDWMQQAYGFMIQSWPYVLGSDVAGEVFEVGSSITRFKKGDRVVGQAQGLMKGTKEDGAFQLYTRVSVAVAALIPDNISDKEAVVLPMAIGTASAGLNEEEHLGQAFPSTEPPSLGKVVIVYGGSSAIGSMTTQLAVASGLRVISIASSKNFDFCRKVGASEVFDYNDANFVEQVIKAVGKDKFVGVFLAIHNETTFKNCLDVLEKLGGGKIATSQAVPETLPANVKAKQFMGVGEHSAPIWAHFVTEALKSGQLKCLPEPLVVGKGLESLQEALDRAQAGVSAQKLVVEL